MSGWLPKDMGVTVATSRSTGQLKGSERPPLELQPPSGEQLSWAYGGSLVRGLLAASQLGPLAKRETVAPLLPSCGAQSQPLVA